MQEFYYIFKSGGAAGTVIATFKFGTEGIEFYVPGSGILFEEGIVFRFNATAEVLHNIYG